MSRSSSGRHKKSSSAKHLRPALPARPASSVPQFPQPTATLPTVPAISTPKQVAKPQPRPARRKAHQRNCLGELLVAILLLAGITGGAVALTLFLVHRPSSSSSASASVTVSSLATATAAPSATKAAAAPVATSTSEPIATNTPVQQASNITILSATAAPATLHNTQALHLTMRFTAAQPAAVTVAWQFYDSHGRLVAEKTQANIVLSYAHGSYTRASEWTPGAALPPGTYHLTAAVGAAVKQTGAVVTILP